MFQVSYYILIGALFLMAAMMFAIPLPQRDDRLKGYLISRGLLALSYIALAVYCIFKGQIRQELFSPVFLFMSNLQAVLLAMSHINLINPRLVSKRFIARHFLPLCVCLLLYIIIRIFSEHIPLVSYSALARNLSEPEVIARLIWMAEYVVIFIYYVIMLYREQNSWSKRSANFFAEDKLINPKLIQYSFIVVMLIGLTTFFITCSLNPLFSALLNYFILLLYIIVGILFMRYPVLFLEMKPLLYEDNSSNHSDENGALTESAERQRWKKQRAGIIERRLYCRSGITLEAVAREIGVSRTILSNTINRQEGMNFNAFINRLRILEAQRLMRKQPELTLAQVAEMTGYTEQSNFSRHFKHWAGQTPAEWKRWQTTVS